MAGTIIPWVSQQFWHGSTLCAGYKLFTYAAGTTTKLATYSDSDLTIANANPIVLDAYGKADIYCSPAAYKFVLALPTDTDPPTSPVDTWDNILPAPPYNVDVDVDGTAGEGIAAREAVYLSAGDGGRTAGRWYLADADLTYGSVTANALGIAPNAITSGSSGTIRLTGRVTGFSGLSVGALYYVSGTAGSITTVAPANARGFCVADSATSVVLTQWIAPVDATATLPGIVNLSAQTLGDGKKHFKQVPTFDPGSSDPTSATTRTSGVISVQSTAVGNVGAGEDTLMTYTLPANVLDANNVGVRVVAWGTFAATANVKTLKFYFGATSVNPYAAAINNAYWWLEAWIIRTGAATQIMTVFSGYGSGSPLSGTRLNPASPTEDTTAVAGIVIKVTGESAAVANDDIVQSGMIIETL